MITGRISIICWILPGELWGVFCEYFLENLQHYKVTELYSEELNIYNEDIFGVPSWNP